MEKSRNLPGSSRKPSGLPQANVEPNHQYWILENQKVFPTIQKTIQQKNETFKQKKQKKKHRPLEKATENP